ncbi:cytochrome c(L), periplasmic [Acidomonas methanolica]|uniref:Cytochrome c-L n=2 Tax=Acidomonas methanolica TaxID=437 RepID=A0A023D5C0_ACIMT|nr:cytochrome c(L), periplasmic [Acidomonas methanolica]TCS24452.1 cytochrome cL apoprotein [Acidomonas methanolica]BAN85789.1 cytochrome c-L precursor [Acidomonas methanolica]GAJ29249.1 cytochrome c-L precursor [Acidomonas methanolica NBRC 104435]GBQ49048.1 cytochrome c-L MxaG [Acidomonas methanolica]GEK99876.1 hypothetical protein AME01nite_23750 [Acidomonas methanolica NBRC 104435]
MRKSFAFAGVLAGSLFLMAADVPPTTQSFINTVTGDKLDLDTSLPDGRQTPAVKEFLQTGRDPYEEVPSCFPNGKSLFLTACSGCHGGEMEGKVGPSLSDDYWTYPVNTTDVGLFSTIFGGANGMMGPHNQDLTLDQILRVMAWIRHHFSGPASHATWLTAEQQKQFKPFTAADEAAIKQSTDPAACKLPATASH